MSDNLTALREQLADAEMLCHHAEQLVMKTALAVDLPFANRAAIFAEFTGFKREVEALRKIERQLLECGTVPATATTEGAAS